MQHMLKSFQLQPAGSCMSQTMVNRDLGGNPLTLVPILNTLPVYVQVRHTSLPCSRHLVDLQDEPLCTNCERCSSNPALMYRYFVKSVHHFSRLCIRKREETSVQLFVLIEAMERVTKLFSHLVMKPVTLTSPSMKWTASFTNTIGQRHLILKISYNS